MTRAKRRAATDVLIDGWNRQSHRRGSFADRKWREERQAMSPVSDQRLFHVIEGLEQAEDWLRRRLRIVRKARHGIDVPNPNGRRPK